MTFTISDSLSMHLLFGYLVMVDWCCDAQALWRSGSAFIWNHSSSHPSSSSFIHTSAHSSYPNLWSLRSFISAFRDQRSSLPPPLKSYINLTLHRAQLQDRMSTPYSPPSPSRNSPAPAYRRSELRVACVQCDVKVCHLILPFDTP